MKNEPTTTTPAEIAHLLRQGASMAREMIGLRRLDARFGERLALDYEEALADLMQPARPAGTLADCLDLAISIVKQERPKTKDVIPCKCTAYLHTHFLGDGDCCGCETSPDCEHWTRIPDYYGTGDRDNVRYERREK